MIKRLPTVGNNFRFFVANEFDNNGNPVPAGSGVVGLRSAAGAPVRSGLEAADTTLVSVGVIVGVTITTG